MCPQRGAMFSASRYETCEPCSPTRKHSRVQSSESLLVSIHTGSNVNKAVATSCLEDRVPQQWHCWLFYTCTNTWYSLIINFALCVLVVNGDQTQGTHSFIEQLLQRNLSNFRHIRNMQSYLIVLVCVLQTIDNAHNLLAGLGLKPKLEKGSTRELVPSPCFCFQGFIM